MKLFSWVHNKFNGRQTKDCHTNIYASNKNQTQQSQSQKEEFSDWPQGLLSIGTLFNKSTKEDTKDQHHQENSSISSHNNPILDITLEEVKELQKELNKLISSNDLDCLTSLGAETEKINHSSSSSNCGEEEDDYDGQEKDQIDHHFNIVANNKAKDVYLNRKKSLSFLLKKMFVCGVGGLGPTPSLRDPTLSAPKTSISKILRAMLRKKIYPQNSCPTTSRKKCLGNGYIESSNNFEDEDEIDTEESDRIKWDKTDTEYIVLEI
ncbi:Transcription antitermination protein NusB [Bienertia sinuspersici]